MVKIDRRNFFRVLGITGTAAVISPVGQITYQGRDYVVAGGKMGELSQRLYNEIVGIQYGDKPDARGWMERIE